MKNKTRKMTTIAILCAMAFVLVAVVRIPIVLFLKYEPKDIVIVIGGFIFGPLTSFIISLVVSVIEMVTISESGILGCIMNVISSCSFACTAAFIYKKKRTLSGAIIGLFCGMILMVAVMLLWNYLIAPIYMGYPREAVVKLLVPAFLPFNLLKGGLNVTLTMLLYKPIITALRQSKMVEVNTIEEKKGNNIGVTLISLLIFASIVLYIMSTEQKRIFE